MADITDPQAVRFCNDFVRTRADVLAQAYYQIVQMIDEWDANPDLAILIPNLAGDIVVDGSAQDGRTPITGQMVHQLIETYSRGFIADLEANSNAKLNILLQISVNPNPAG